MSSRLHRPRKSPYSMPSPTSFDIAMDIDSMSDQSSVLTDTPSLFKDCDSDTAEGFDDISSPNSSNICPMTPSSAGASPMKRLRKRIMYSPYASSSEDFSIANASPLTKRVKLTRKVVPLSPIEKLPNEILQSIAARLEDDASLCNLLLSSPVFSSIVNSNESEVWRVRFTHQFDHPIVTGASDFDAAYKLRKLVLKNFVSFAEGITRRTQIQLEVLRDMIIETYFEPKTWRPIPTMSRNLELFRSPNQSPWMLIFLSTAYPNITSKNRHGEADSFFETVQLVLSHLLLSPSQALARLATGSRDKYDMIKVYNFNRPFTTLYTRYKTDASTSAPSPRSKLFPNLDLSKPLSPAFGYKLHTNALLHIRNFWHYHLNREKDALTGEHSLSDMANALMKMGKTPREWSSVLGSKSIIPTKWFGVYGCLHPWPKTRKDLEERQSCAEDWTHHVDPLELNVLTSSDYEDGFWPPAFSSIPALENTIPSPVWKSKAVPKSPATTAAESVNQVETHNFPRPDDNNPVYIRGIASFLNTREHSDASSFPPSSLNPLSPVSTTKSREKFLKYHPYNSARIRGVIHDIPLDSTVVIDVDDDNDNDTNKKKKKPNMTQTIPGWKRIVMMIYKPNINYLVNVLEHAMEDYGGPFGAQVTNILNSASLWNTSPNSTPTTISTTTTTTTTSTTSGTSTTTTRPNQIDPTVLHTHLQTRLYNLLLGDNNNNNHSSSPTTLPEKYTAHTIQQLEDAFSPPPHFLTWENDDIDYAYVYEGVILPGGKIMLGRYWRCHGITGTGDGMEVGEEGVLDDFDEMDIDNDNDNNNNQHEHGDIVGDQSAATTTAGATATATAGQNLDDHDGGLDRGPFCFWCA